MSLPTPPSTCHRDKENRLPPGCRISWSQQNQYHYLSSPISDDQGPKPSGSRSPPPKSILKKTSHPLLPFEDDSEQCQRETTPEPSDPLVDLDYLAHPVAAITAPGATPLRQVIEAYSVLTARLKSAVPATTDADASWPLFQPIRRHADALVAALVRDLGRALESPGAPAACDDARVLLPSPKSSPKKRVGMTAEQVKHARDLCTTSHAVMKLLAVVFTAPAIYGVFTDEHLGSILTQLLAIPLADELPTPNARKTCALAIWLLQSQRLPASVLEPAGPRIAYALRRGIEGELGKEGKKGSANDGLKAIHDLATYQPATFLPAFAPLLPSILLNLLAPTLVLRTQACHALGGLVLGLTALPSTPATLDLHARLSAAVATFLLPPTSSPRAPASPSKDPLIIRTLRTTLQATDPQAPAQGPAWALAALGALTVLLGPRLYTDARLSRAVSALLALAMRHRKSSVRGLACVVWRAVAWVWLQPPFPSPPSPSSSSSSPSSSPSEDAAVVVTEKREAFWRVLKSVVDIGAGVSTVAALRSPGADADEDGEGGLRRVMQVLRAMIKKGGQSCAEAMELLRALVAPAAPPAPWAPARLLPRGLFAAQPGVLSVEYRALMGAVRPLLEACAGVDDVRALARAELAREWVFDELMGMWRAGLGYLELPDEYGTPAEVVAVWEGLIQASVATLQDAGDGPGLTQFAVTVTETLIDVLQDSTLDLTVKHGPPRKELSSSSPMRVPLSTLSSGSLKLSIARDLWTSVRTHVPLDHLYHAGHKLVACLVDGEEDLVGDYDGPLHEDDARKHWAMLCAEVLYLCDRDELRSFWGAKCETRRRTPATWSKKPDVRCLVWAAFLHKWQDERHWDWDGAIVLLCVPFLDAHGWELTNDDFTAWDTFLAYAMSKAPAYGLDPSAVLDEVARTVAQNPTPAFADAARIADQLLTQLELADARELPADLLEFANDVLTATYPPAPRSKVTASWLLRALTRALSACPRELALQMLEIVRDGVAVWVADAFAVFDAQEYEDDVVPLYQTAVLSIQSLPCDLETLETVAPILESAFGRKTRTPPAMLEAFDMFWTSCYASMDVPASGWPSRIEACIQAVAAGPLAEHLAIDPVLLAEDAANESVEESIAPEQVPEQTPERDEDEEPLSFPESEDEDEENVFQAAPIISPPRPAVSSPLIPSVFDFSHPPTTPNKAQLALQSSSPSRPQKQAVTPIAFFPFPQSPGTPSHRTAPATPKRTPASISIFSASRSSPSKRRKVDGGGKENVSPRPVIASFAERLALRSPATVVLGKRRAENESPEGSPVKKGKVLEEPVTPPSRNSALDSDDSADERLVEESLIANPLDDPFVVSVSTSKKRKRMFIDAVEVPSLQSVLLRDRQLATSPSKRTLRRTRSMVLPAGPSFVQSLVYRSARKPVRRRVSEDPFALSDPFSDVGVRSDDSLAWSSDRIPSQLSSDDDPHIGQVTPHHLISPALRRAPCDPPSDDSVLGSSPSPSSSAAFRCYHLDLKRLSAEESMADPQSYLLTIQGIDDLSWASAEYSRRREKRKPNLFVEAYVDQQPPHKTRTADKTLKATWDETFTILSAQESSRLLIKLKHKSFLSFHKCFGTITLSVRDLLRQCEGGNFTQLKLEHGPKPAPSDAEGTLSVCIEPVTIAQALENNRRAGGKAVERLQPKSGGVGRVTAPSTPDTRAHLTPAGTSAAGGKTSRSSQEAREHPRTEGTSAATRENLEVPAAAEGNSSRDGGVLAPHVESPKATSSDLTPENSACAPQEDPARHQSGLAASVAAISPKVETVVSNISQNTDVFISLGAVLEKVKLIANATANAMDVLTEIHPYAKAAWQVLDFAHKAYAKQVATDTAAIDLVKQMEDLYAFVGDIESLPGQIKQLRRIIVRVLEQTTDCVNFFQQYTEPGFLARLVGQALVDHAKTISDMTSTMMQLRDALDSGLGLQTATVVVRSDNLKCLEPAKMNAAYRPVCLPGTRVDAQKAIIEWLETPSEQNILWLHGAAGLGKSAVATTIAEYFREQHRRGAFLFFDRNVPIESDPSRVISTLAHQLAEHNETIGAAISAAIGDDRQPLSAPLASQFDTLLSKPLSKTSAEISRPIIIVLDALDECGDAGSRRILLDILSSPQFANLPRHFRFLITSRPDLDIKNALTCSHVHPVDFSMASDTDLYLYITSELQTIYAKRHITADLEVGWPGEMVMRRLVVLAAGLFIWAATVMRHLHEYWNPAQWLSDLAQGHETLGLRDLYKTALLPLWQSEMAETGKKIVGLILVSQVPLTDETIANLLGFSDSGYTCRLVLQRLGCVVQWSKGQPARMLHKSFPDYLTDHSACGAESWFIVIKDHQLALTVGCLRIMNSQLRFNICNLRSSHVPNADIAGLAIRVNAVIPQHLKYACLFLRHHLRLTPSGQPIILSSILQLFESKFLFWLEVLSLMGEVQAASQTITVVKSWVPVSQAFNREAPSLIENQSTATQLQALAQDALKFIRVFAPVIAHSTPHIYISCIPLSPPSSIIKQRYMPSLKNTLVISGNVNYGWAALQLVYAGHTNAVLSAAFSPDGRHIASGSEDGTVHIWDAETALLVAGPIQGHIVNVNSVSFSPDGHKVASGSDDWTVCIWDSETGALAAGPFLGHTDYVLSVAFSRDGRQVASGSSDCSVRIWDAEAGVLTAGPFEGHSDWVRSVAFSPDGLKIASGSDDTTIRIWNVEIGTLVAGPFTGHTGGVRSVVFSPHGRHVASGSDDKTICIWGVETGNLIAGPLEGHTSWVMSVAYSPDGSQVASGSYDRTVRLWDLQSGTVTRTFKGHTDCISSVAFSSDGQRIASASDDGTVRIWDAEAGPLVTDTSNPFKGHTQDIRSIAFSPDGRHIVSGSEDRTLCIWDAETGGLAVGPLEGHTAEVYSVAYSPDGRQVASGSADKTGRIWNVEKGSHTALAGHTDWVFSVALSPDGQKVASGSDDMTVRIWDVANGTLTAGPFEGHTNLVWSVVFSPDGRRVASGSEDKSVRIWDVEAGVLAAGSFEGHTDMVLSVAFSPDGRKIASGSSDRSIRILDVEAGSSVVIKGHTGSVWSVAFSPDGRHVASGSEDGTVRIWDAKTGVLIVGPFERQSGRVYSVMFSPDGQCLASASSSAIRIFDVSTLSALPNPADSPSLHSQEQGRNEVRVAEGFPQSSRLLESGWMVDSAGGLLFYVPHELRAGLCWPDETAVIFTADMRSRMTKLDGSRFVHGEGWARCHAGALDTVHIR
ncbi:hypothetical protein HWV62_2653 [Athelia sp. TMB]|nr:hypothetical protein HWV62_2653 [Athelia sp. TMB]